LNDYRQDAPDLQALPATFFVLRPIRKTRVTTIGQFLEKGLIFRSVWGIMEKR
jgi:hypothetical protein